MNIISIDAKRKRCEIEATYQEALNTWQKHYEVAEFLLRAERDLKFALSKSVRDLKIREIDAT